MVVAIADRNFMSVLCSEIKEDVFINHIDAVNRAS